MSNDRRAAHLLDEALAALVEGCDAVGIPPEEWHSINVGPFDPESTAGWVGRVDAHDEDPPDNPPRYYYDLRITAGGVGDVDGVAERYAALRLAGGWVPSNDFTTGSGERYKRTVYFDRPDGARTGIAVSASRSVQTFDSPTTTDDVVMTPGAGVDGSSAEWAPGSGGLEDSR